MQTERTFTTPLVRPLSTLPTAHPASELVARQRFATLQRRMAFVDAAARRRRAGRSLVVVPSRTPESWDEPAAKTQAYEERLLCTLQMLADEDLSIVYVTSSPVATTTVDYYLSLLPARRRWSARRRLTMLSTCDTAPCSLSAKVLAQPRLIAQIRAALPVHGLAQLVPYDTTTVERDLALALDIPMYGADPSHRELGTKTGSRELFARAGAPHPIGIERIWCEDDLVAAIALLRERRPRLEQVVVKLNEGVTGRGNAIVDLRGCSSIAERVASMTLEAEDLSVPAYLARLGELGGIVEERITGEELRSPSVQLNLTPGGTVEVVSTHDQLLGGRSGQSYLGCVFPAAPDYAEQIVEIARGVGDELARTGVIGRCAIDFVVARERGGWRPYAIELNLRKGGTTHPFLTADLLTGGTCGGYVASDHLHADGLCGDRAIEVLQHSGLAFDPKRGAGVVLHMLGAAEPLGRIGATAIAATASEARALYAAAASVLAGQAHPATGANVA
jgi:pheganomycin biosynthesis PGM1-like protein/ATP-grasp domain-containing protein